MLPRRPPSQCKGAAAPCKMDPLSFGPSWELEFACRFLIVGRLMRHRIVHSSQVCRQPACMPAPQATLGANIVACAVEPPWLSALGACRLMQVSLVRTARVSVALVSSRSVFPTSSSSLWGCTGVPLWSPLKGGMRRQRWASFCPRSENSDSIKVLLSRRFPRRSSSSGQPHQDPLFLPRSTELW